MARRSAGPPKPGFDLVAAAYALFGTERKAAASLGVSRGTINDILRGRTGAGAKTRAGARNAPGAATLERVAASLAAGRTPDQVREVARQRARQERKSPGSTERQAVEHERAMRAQGLDIRGEQLYDAAGRRITPARDASWETLQQRYQSGELDFNQERYAKRRAALEEAHEDEDIEPMFGDEEWEILEEEREIAIREAERRADAGEG